MQLNTRTVAVTGATGFLGRYIVDTLLERGARVIGVVRNPDRVPALRERGVELRRADLADRAALQEAFAGVDAVVSNAALLSLGGSSWRDLESANVAGTRNVFHALADAGVQFAVQISSIAAYRDQRRRDISEDYPLRAPAGRIHRLNAYGHSKARSETEAREIAAARAIGLTVLRVAGIYGAFDVSGFTAWFKRLMRLPVAPYPVGMGSALVYAGDVAEAVALALEKPGPASRTYNIAGPDRTFWEFAREWKRAGGQTPRLMLPIPVPTRPSFDVRRATTELDWRPRSYAAGCRDMLERERGAEA